MVSGKVSPGAAGARGSPQAPGSVCCMCGDHGLLPELFRCSACFVRSQHTYCTDRYPKAESYGTCNWCLTADGDAASTSNSPRSAGKTMTTGQQAAAHGDTAGGGGRSPKVAARGDFASSNLSKPIKKQHYQQRLVLRRSASDLGSRVGADHNAPPSPGVARGRPRVRRYKLLEEVITTS